MKLLVGAVTWVKSHIAVSLIIFLIISGCIAMIIVRNNKGNENDNNNKKEFIIQDGTYSCELMYNGKSIKNADVIEEYKNKLESFDSSLNFGSTEQFKEAILEYFDSVYIVKNNDIVSLNIYVDGEYRELYLYNINDKKFSVGNTKNDTEDEYVDFSEKVLNKFLSVEQTENSFIYKNFGSTLVYPSIYNNSLLSGKTFDLNDYEYLFPGDLVCNKKIDSNNNKSHDNDEKSKDDFLYEQYAGKYIGVGSDNASKSYIELLNDKTAYVNINYCEGWSLYKGMYYFTTAEYTGETEIYITSLTPYDGISIDVPDALFFSVDGNKLFTLIGYLGSNNFDCSVSTDFVKQ